MSPIISKLRSEEPNTMLSTLLTKTVQEYHLQRTLHSCLVSLARHIFDKVTGPNENSKIHSTVI
jgi:hypothetical protein